MCRKWFSMLVQAAAMTIVLVAVCQELEKPAAERKWVGKVAGVIPYDFRLPTWERIKETYWNPYDSRIFLPMVFGVGWGINFYALLEKLRLIGEAVTEEDFLMPTESIKKTLEHAPGSEEA